MRLAAVPWVGVRPVAEGPFTVVWEGCDVGDPSSPDAQWEQYERTYDDERTAVHSWCNATLYENTRPVSITPEPDWSRYTYDGRNPVKK